MKYNDFEKIILYKNTMIEKTNELEQNIIKSKTDEKKEISNCNSTNAEPANKDSLTPTGSPKSNIYQTAPHTLEQCRFSIVKEESINEKLLKKKRKSSKGRRKKCAKLNDNQNINKKTKKEYNISEKELQRRYEKKLLENIGKEYSDNQYNEDMIKCDQNKERKFMKDNFPIMYRKDKYYLYTINVEKRRKNYDYFIHSNEFKMQNNADIKDLNDPSNYSDFEIKNSLSDKHGKHSNNSNNFKMKKTKKNFPKHVWSPNKEEIDLEQFYDDCAEIWPNDECSFIKEIALEFLMKNEYIASDCIKNLEQFVLYMKKRAQELDFPLTKKNTKTVKRYDLRKTSQS